MAAFEKAVFRTDTVILTIDILKYSPEYSYIVSIVFFDFLIASYAPLSICAVKSK